MTLKPLHLFFVFISVFNISFSDKADSLKTALTNAKEDTAKVKLLNALGWELSYQNPDTSILLGKKALELAERLPSPKGEGLGVRSKLIASTNSNLGVYYWLKGDYPLSLSHHFKALEIRKQLDDKKGIASSLGNIGLVYYKKGNYPEALKNYFAALKIDEELGDKKGIAGSYNNIGLIYDNQGNYPEALKNYFAALKINEEIDNKNWIANNFNNIGLIYDNQGNYPEALKNYFASLKIDEELGDKKGIAGSYNNIGNIYQYQGNYPEALKNYFAALKINEEMDNKNWIAKNFNNIGSIYANQGNYPEALKNHFAALKIDEELGDKAGISSSYNNIGIIYYKQGNYPEAMKNYFAALKIDEELGDKAGIAISYLNIGSIELTLNNIVHSKKYLDDALTLAKEIGYKETIKNSYSSLSQLDSTTGNFKDAYNHYKFYALYKDSLINEEKSKEIGRIEMRHEFEMAEMERKRVESEKLKVESEKIKRRNLLQYSGILLTLVFLFVGIFLLARRFRKIKEDKIYAQYVKIVKATLFISFLIFFEFILVLLAPFIENITGGEPVYKLLANAVLAGAIFPLHSLLEAKLKAQIVKTERGKWAEEVKRSGSKSFFISLLVVLLFNNSFSDKTDSLKTAIGSVKEDTAKVNLLNNVATQYFLFAPDSALIYLMQASSLSNKVGFDKGLAESFDGLARFYWMKGNYPKALENLFEKLKLYTKLGDKKGIAASLGNIGIVYNDQGNYPKALKYYFETLVIEKALGNKKGIAADLGNIGIVYRRQASAANSRQDIANSDSLYAKALKHFFEALEIDKELGFKNGMAINLGNIGSVYFEQADAAKSRQDITGSHSLYAKALKHYFEALEINKELGKKSGIAIKLGNIGSLYTQTGRFKEAEAYLDSALVICNTIGTLNYTMQFEEAISHLYDTTDRYQLAYQHYKKYSTAKDSLFNEEKSKGIGRLEQNHEFEMEELKNEIIKKEELRIKNEEIKRRNSLQYSSIFLVLIFLFGLVFFLIRISLPEWMLKLSTFVPFMILFEFILVLLDPYIENITGGEPLYTLLINALCAAIIFPMHSYFEKKLKARIYDIKQKKEKEFEEEFRKEAEKSGNR